MIRAEEARRKSYTNSKRKKCLEILEEHINEAIKNGNVRFTIEISSDDKSGFNNIVDDDVKLPVLMELEDYGYNVDLDLLPKMNEHNQWIESGYITVSWA